MRHCHDCSSHVELSTQLKIGLRDNAPGSVRRDKVSKVQSMARSLLHFFSNPMTTTGHSFIPNVDPFSEPLPIMIWVEPRGPGTGYYVDTKDVTADLSRGIVEAYERHPGREGRYPVVVLIDEHLPISTLAQLREVIDKTGATNVRYFLTSPGSRSIGEISFGQIVSAPDRLRT